MLKDQHQDPLSVTRRYCVKTAKRFNTNTQKTLRTVATEAGAGPKLCVCMCVWKLIGVGPLARIMNDSDDVVDWFILHPWNPKRLKMYPHNFLLYRVQGPYRPVPASSTPSVSSDYAQKNTPFILCNLQQSDSKQSLLELINILSAAMTCEWDPTTNTPNSGIPEKAG